MGQSFFFNWFGMSVEQLKEIRETNKNLTTLQRKKLDALISKKENAAKKSK